MKIKSSATLAIGLLLLAADCAGIEVSRRFPGCRLDKRCGDLLGVDCNAAIDGPYYYVRKSDLSIVSGCGGLCMSGTCKNCPPKEWTCSTY